MPVVRWSQQPQGTTCERLGDDTPWPHAYHRQAPETCLIQLRHPSTKPVVVIPSASHPVIGLHGKIVPHMNVGQLLNLTANYTPTLLKDS